MKNSETRPQKNHYRKVFKSDHLGVADLEDLQEQGKRFIFTIKEVKQEYNVSVAGRKGNHNIAYFKESIKPLVLNATNSKVLKRFANGSPFVEDWRNMLVELYIDTTVKMKGEIVGGVRILPTQPVLTKPTLNEKHPKWNDAKNAVKNGGATIESIRKHYNISDNNFKKLLE